MGPAIALPKATLAPVSALAALREKATRNLSRAAKILARAAPLGLIIPVMVYLSAVPTSRPQMASRAPTAAAPPAESQPPREDLKADRSGSAETAEAERRAAEQARQG